MSMFPGYSDAPYHSPVIVRALRLLGNRRFDLDFVNIGYAAGVQHAQITLRTLHRGSSYMAALREGGPDRAYIFLPMTRAWLQMHVPHLGNQPRLFDDGGLPVRSAFEDLMV